MLLCDRKAQYDQVGLLHSSYLFLNEWQVCCIIHHIRIYLCKGWTNHPKFNLIIQSNYVSDQPWKISYIVLHLSLTQTIQIKRLRFLFN